MNNPTTFEPRLIDALGRLADLAPVMDEVQVVDVATEAEPSWATRLFGGKRSVTNGRTSPRLAYLLIVTALLIAALVASLVIGSLLPRPLIVPGRNGAITFMVQGFDHSGNHVDVLGADGAFIGHAFGVCPTFAADGSAVAYTAGDDGHLVVATPDGTVIREFPEINAQTILRPWLFALSPDGTQVAWLKRQPQANEAGETIDSDYELWLMPVDGSPGRRLLGASGTGETRLYPVWSPDMSRIAFQESAPSTETTAAQTANLYVVDVEDGELERISTRLAVGAEGVSWSPDSQSLAYMGVPDGSPVPAEGYAPAADVYVVGADGTNETNVTNTVAFEWQVAWSPDGLRLAFIKSPADDDVHHLVSMPMTGARPSGIPIDGPATDSFTWAPDATKILWVGGMSDGSPDVRTSTLNAVDRDFQSPSLELYSTDGSFLCTPSWQRLDPEE